MTNCNATHTTVIPHTAVVHKQSSHLQSQQGRHRCAGQLLTHQQNEAPTTLVITSYLPTEQYQQWIDEQAATKYVAGDMQSAIALLATKRVSLVIVPFPKSLTYGGWETYKELCRHAQLPILLLPL